MTHPPTRFAVGDAARLILLCGLMIAAALAMTAASARAEDSDILTVRFASDVSNLDPARIFQIENQTVATQIYNGLVKYDEATNEIVPDLAGRWDVSDDGSVYTFHLRDGVTFHKGYGQMTSQDVAFSFQRVLDPATGSAYSGQLASIAEIATPDPLTVVVTLKGPNSGFLHKVAAFNQGWIVSKSALEDIGADTYAMNPVGTGPFVFDRWTPGQETRVVANPDYFGGAPKLAEVVFRIIADETAAAVALENGEINVFYNLQQPQIIDRLKNDDGVVIHDRDANHTINLVLNMTNPPLDDLKVRRAIMMGVNRKGMIDGFFKGTKSPAYSVLTPSFVEYSQDMPSYDFDPEAAAKLIEEAGASGEEVEIVGPAASPYDKLVVALGADLAAVGLKPKVTILERGAYLQARNKGDVDTVITGVVGAPDPDSPVLSMLSRSAFPPGLNTAHYDGIEDLIVAAGKASTTQERNAVYGTMMQKVMTDLPVIPLYTDHLFIAVGANVKGFVQNSLFTMSAYPVSLED